MRMSCCANQLILSTLEHDEFAGQSVWCCRYLCKMIKGLVIHSLVLPVLLYSCETWTLTGELRRRLNSFCTMSLRRIFGYRLHDYISNDLVLGEAGLRQVTRIVREHKLRLYGHVARHCRGSRPSDSFLSRSEGLNYAEVASTGFMVASGGVLSEGYGHSGNGGPGDCLGDGQTEAEGVPLQGGRGDALLRRMTPYLTLT